MSTATTTNAPVTRMHPRSRTRVMVYRTIVACGDAVDMSGMDSGAGGEGDPMYVPALAAVLGARRAGRTWTDAVMDVFGNLTPPETVLMRSSRLPEDETLSLAADLAEAWFAPGPTGRGKD